MSTIAVEALTKRYGTVTAVSDLSFELAPGRITGFLGPNGAGKSTTIRLLLGLAEPTSGRATINGHPYAELRDPLRHIGALTGPGGPGPHGLRVQPPARRTGPDRRRRDHHQPRPARGGGPDGRPARTRRHLLARRLLPRRDLRGRAPGPSRLHPGKEPVMRSLV